MTLVITLPLAATTGFIVRRKARYSRRMVASPAAVDHLKFLLSNGPVVPYAVDAASHLHIVTEHVQWCLQAALVPDPAVPKRYYIGKETFAAIKQRGQWRKHTLAISRALIKFNSRMILRSWRRVAAFRFGHGNDGRFPCVHVESQAHRLRIRRATLEQQIRVQGVLNRNALSQEFATAEEQRIVILSRYIASSNHVIAFLYPGVQMHWNLEA